MTTADKGGSARCPAKAIKRRRTAHVAWKVRVVAGIAKAAKAATTAPPFLGVRSETIANKARTSSAARAPRRKPTRAFSMLELVVALAVVAVVAVYAMPTYREHLARGHRRTAIAALYRAAHFLEGGGYDPLSARSKELPAGLARAPDVGAAVYRLQVLPADASNGGYAIEARPLEASPMSNDPCGTFVIDAVGRRTNRAAGGRAPPRVDCWLAR